MRTWEPWRRSTKPATIPTTRTTVESPAMTKSVWDDADGEVRKAAAIIDKIKRGLAAWQKPWKPQDLLKPLTFDLSFYLARPGHPKRVKDPSEGTDG